MQFISREMAQYKANIHSHSYLSDGDLSPEQLAKAYKEEGYSILAITDHEAPYDHSHLSDKDFLMLTGYEAYIRTNSDCHLEPLAPEIHLNLFAKDEHCTTFIGFDREYCKYLTEEQQDRRKKAEDLGPRQYSHEYIQGFIDSARANGYLVSYNHPVWAMENPGDIIEYEGCFSMEVFNTGSQCINGYENNMPQYDQMLRRGRKIYCHGADDNHNKEPFGDLLCDSFGAWTMILAEKLEYQSVIEALEQGRFYASTGPEILCFESKGKSIHMEFSPVQRAIMHVSPKRSYNVYEADGRDITSCDFEVPDWAPYVYFSLIDREGRRAQLRAFSREELGI